MKQFPLFGHGPAASLHSLQVCDPSFMMRDLGGARIQLINLKRNRHFSAHDRLLVIFFNGKIYSVLTTTPATIGSGGAMAMDSDEKALRTRRYAAWLIAEYAVLERRLDLINRYNEAVGRLSASVTRVQGDFIYGRMEPEELVAFVNVCKSLISAVTHQHR